MSGVKDKWRSNVYYYITTLSLLHFLETGNTQKSEVLLLKISLGNVNASVNSCRYPQIFRNSL